MANLWTNSKGFDTDNGYALIAVITTTRLFKYMENFTSKQTEDFQIQTLLVFIFLLKNIHCGYSLEPPRRGGSNEYPHYMLLRKNKKKNVYPCKP